MTDQPAILYRVEGTGASLTELLSDLDAQAQILFGPGNYRLLGAVTVDRETVRQTYAGPISITYTGAADYVNEAWR